MREDDDRQLAEANEEHLMRLLALLQKVKRGLAGETEAFLLAQELGITTEYRRDK
jgi:hypothetical protein